MAYLVHMSWHVSHVRDETSIRATVVLAQMKVSHINAPALTVGQLAQGLSVGQEHVQAEGTVFEGVRV